MTTGIILAVMGFTGVAVTILLQVVLIPVFRKQQKKLLLELEG